MNVLTIDLDYMSTNYAKLVDSIYSNDFTNKRWGEFYKNTYYSEDHFKVNIDNWLFILDVYTKQLLNVVTLLLVMSMTVFFLTYKMLMNQ